VKFIPLTLEGAFLVEPEYHEDERGFFARSWCAREFAAQNISDKLAQCNISYNRLKGTLRGMHYQQAPFAEDKLVRVTQGAIYDVIVDLRPTSTTFLQWFGVELTMENHLAVYVPQGFAHGFETLSNDCEVFYQMSEFFAPNHARGFRWDDPLIGITWPIPVSVISDRDRNYDDLKSLNE
jgi:dTDP-4-dehydrorhamnose 3,5-epimerase